MENIYNMIKHRISELGKSPDIADRIIKFAKDIVDDGKRNYSNEPSKESPGRKPKIELVKKRKKALFGVKK